MKLYILSFLFVFTSFPIFTQDKYNFVGLQGLKSEDGDIIFEFRGYDITVSPVYGDITDNTLVNEFKDGNVIADYTDKNIKLRNRIIESEVVLNDQSSSALNKVVYLLEQLQGIALSIKFLTHNQRDIIMERAFVDAFFKKELDAYIVNTWSASTIDFIGQKIQLGDECMWRKPHTVECGDARISWSEFLTKGDAVLDLENRIRFYDPNLLLTVEESDIEVVFEGEVTVARRIVYRKMKEMDGPFLISYYLVQKVEDHYVSCVLSNFAYNKKDYGLAPLLQQLMSIPHLPKDAYSVEEVDYIEYVDDGSLHSPELEIQASSWTPIGRLKDVFSYAPALGVVFKIPLKHQLSIDLAAQFAIPLDKGKFEYKKDGLFYETQSDVLYNMSLRCRRYNKISKHFRLSPYLGVGLNGIQTDIERWEDDGKNFEVISTIDVFGGLSLQYKKIGVFAEYHYTPYSIKNRVESRFGNSAFNIGLFYSITLN